MKQQRILIGLLVLVVLLLAAVVGLTYAQGPEPPRPLASQNGVGTGFTYQGRLESGGKPVNDDCDIAFRLYGQAGGGSELGTVTHTVPISDGLFTVGLDFGASAFTGDARWLGMAVRCPAGSGVYDTLSPRQPLSPAPYAIYATHAMTSTIASDVEADAITPIHLNGISGNGTSGQALASDGSGGFAWQDSASGPVRQLVQDFVLASGENVSAGDVVSFLNGRAYGPSEEWGAESVFNTASTSYYIAVSALSATDFVVAYRDYGNSEYGTAITGTVSEGSLSWGSASVFNAASTGYIAVSALSATDFVVAYYDGGNSNYGTAITATVSGGTLSWGTASVFNAATTGNVAVSALSDTDFVIAYTDLGNSDYGTAITGTLSGGAVRWGGESVFNTGFTYDISVSSLSATDFVVAYKDAGNFDYGTAITGTASGGSLSWGAESVFNAAGTDSTAVSNLSDSDFVVAYRDAGNSLYGTAITGTVSGGSLSWGTESVFNAANTSYIEVSGLSATDFVVSYADGDNSGYGTAIVGTVSGGSLRWGVGSVFNAANTNYIAVSALSATDFVVAYEDLGNSSYGTAIAGNQPIGARLIGTTRAAASGGETVTVIIGGVSDVHSGLVPGGMYYLQADGSLGVTPTDYRIGLAISETELILDQLW